MKYVKFNFRELFKQSTIEELFAIRNRRLLTHRTFELNEETSPYQWFVIDLTYERKGEIFPVMVSFFKCAGAKRVQMKLREFMSFNNKPLPKSTIEKINTMFNLLGLEVVR